jgi:hypothetical protein
MEQINVEDMKVGMVVDLVINRSKYADRRYWDIYEKKIVITHVTRLYVHYIEKRRYGEEVVIKIKKEHIKEVKLSDLWEDKHDCLMREFRTFTYYKIRDTKIMIENMLKIRQTTDKLVRVIRG